MAKKNPSKSAKSKTKNSLAQDFVCAAPSAKSVQLVGDFTLWQSKPINMKKDADGVWRVTVELPSGTHRYRFLVDGQWWDDSACQQRVPNPFGGEDAVRQVA